MSFWSGKYSLTLKRARLRHLIRDLADKGVVATLSEHATQTSLVLRSLASLMQRQLDDWLCSREIQRNTCSTKKTCDGLPTENHMINSIFTHRSHLGKSQLRASTRTRSDKGHDLLFPSISAPFLMKQATSNMRLLREGTFRPRRDETPRHSRRETMVDQTGCRTPLREDVCCGGA